ncbi:MAG: Fur family transcriptional regulator [Angustibacter sp.]
MSAAAGADAADTAIQQATALLRARGDRMTAPRRAVLAALSRHSDHLTADQVVTAVAHADPSVHRASVYRALETLSHLGVVQHVHVGHGTTTYHLADDELHLHAQCERCGAVVDLPASLLDGVVDQVDRLHRFALDPTHVALSGLCAACREGGGTSR